MAARVTGQHAGQSWRLDSVNGVPQFRQVADGLAAFDGPDWRTWRALGCWARVVLVRVRGVRSPIGPGLVLPRHA